MILSSSANGTFRKDRVSAATSLRAGWRRVRELSDALSSNSARKRRDELGRFRGVDETVCGLRDAFRMKILSRSLTLSLSVSLFLSLSLSRFLRRVQIRFEIGRTLYAISELAALLAAPSRSKGWFAADAFEKLRYSKVIYSFVAATFLPINLPRQRRRGHESLPVYVCERVCTVHERVCVCVEACVRAYV